LKLACAIAIYGIMSTLPGRSFLHDDRLALAIANQKCPPFPPYRREVAAFAVQSLDPVPLSKPKRRLLFGFGRPERKRLASVQVPSPTLSPLERRRQELEELARLRAEWHGR
jgi:hypothetical protein